MRYTAAEAAKLLRACKEELELLGAKEKESREFVAAIQEDIEQVRPPYDFAKTQAQLDAVEAKIRRIKHAMNVFNTTHKVPGFGMTIDEVLVYLPQLNRRKDKYAAMCRRLAKQRVETGYSQSNNIEYDYANYSIDEAQARFVETREELARLQTALDLANSRETMEIDV